MKRPDKKSLIVNSRNIKNLVKSIKKEMRKISQESQIALLRESNGVTQYRSQFLPKIK